MWQVLLPVEPPQSLHFSHLYFCTLSQTLMHVICLEGMAQVRQGREWMEHKSSRRSPLMKGVRKAVASAPVGGPEIGIFIGHGKWKHTWTEAWKNEDKLESEEDSKLWFVWTPGHTRGHMEKLGRQALFTNASSPVHGKAVTIRHCYGLNMGNILHRHAERASPRWQCGGPLRGRHSKEIVT